MSLEKKTQVITRRTAMASGLAASSLLLTANSGLGASETENNREAKTMEPGPSLKDAWSAYNAAVESARLAMEATPRFKERTDHRATAYYSLAEAQSMAYGFALATRMDHPIINTRSWYHNSHTLGGTSADLYHVSAAVDGRHSYRLFGRVGDLKVLVMQVFNTILGGAGQKQVVNVDLAKMADASGNFEAILSAEPRRGNWIPIDAKSDFNFLFIRRFFDDWYGDRGTLDIELLDGPIDNKDLDEAEITRRVLRAADVLTFLVERWNIGVYDIYLSRNNGKKNSVAVVPGSEIASDTAGSPSTVYTWGVFDIQEDEALIIESAVPQSVFWSLQVQDVWTKPINYLDHQSDINHKRAIIDSDGKFRAVICLKDPGVANWLDTDGHREGTIVGRAYHARVTPPTPMVKLTKFTDLKKHLPSGTKFLTREERRAALKLRRNGLLRIFGDI
ncbi:MAG: DUF1214 domain-containing protein [Steroidobacteraceae bacterium]